MRNRTRHLSWKIELAIVLGLAFGWTVPATLRLLLTSATPTHGSMPLITDTSLWHILVIELISSSLLVPLLYVRGWTLTRLGIRPSFWGSLTGVMLALIAYGMDIRLAILVRHLQPAVGRTLPHAHILGWGYSWTSIILVSIINAFYEETFVCGYLISVLTERISRASTAPTTADREGIVRKDVMNSAQPLSSRAVIPAIAVSMSAAIRLFYHAYQGISGVLTVVPVGLLFGIWFARTRTLWPLIVAHAIIDFVAFSGRVG